MSEFHAVYNATLLELILMQKNNSYDNFKMYSELLGYKSADALHGILNAHSKNTEHYFLARYLGAQRAIRDFSVNYAKVQSPVFHLWNMTLTYITEKYGHVFYLANEWQLEKKHDLYDDSDWNMVE